LQVENLPMKDIWEEAKDAKDQEKKGKVNDDLPLFGNADGSSASEKE
jgi:hypothetical protein